MNPKNENLVRSFHSRVQSCYFSDSNPPSLPSIKKTSPIRNKYERKSDLISTGKIHKVGEENLFVMVQEAAKGHTLPELYSRFVRGDVTAIGDPIECNVDLTKAPSSALEAQNVVAQAYQYFEALPADVRKEYNNDARLYLEKLSDGTIFKQAQDRKAEVARIAALEKEAQASRPVFTPEQLEYLNNAIGGKK